jgi:hypothetical protein
MMAPLYLTRADWGARYGPAPAVPLPYNEVVVHTVAGADRDPAPGFQHLPANATVETVKQAMRNIESFHRNDRRWPAGVGYNFIIFGAVIGAPDGVICEGQGWGRRGTHTESRNAQLGLSFYGHGDLGAATEEQWRCADWLIRLGLRTRRLLQTYKVTGHRNYSRKGKTCPGALIYPHLGRLRLLRPDVPNTEQEALVVTKDDEKAIEAIVEGVVARKVAHLELLIDALAIGEHYKGHPSVLKRIHTHLAGTQGDDVKTLRSVVENVFNKVAR